MGYDKEENPDIDERDGSWIGEGVALIFALGFVAVFIALVIRVVKWIIGF